MLISEDREGFSRQAFAIRTSQAATLVSSDNRRWSPKKHHDEVVWVIAPGLPEDYDAGSDDANAVLKFIREGS